MEPSRWVRGKSGKIPMRDSGSGPERVLKIKAWRAQESEAGRPCDLSDYYVQHGICPECGGDGVQMIGWSVPEDDAERQAAREHNFE
jgi:hypothetical protein